MFSACRLRLFATFSRMRLELLLYSQADNADFNTWALKLKNVLPSYPSIYQDMKGIIEGKFDNDHFLSSEIRISALSNSIINYTSACEYYLSDFIRLMLTNNKLFKRGLDLINISINKFDIIEFNDIEDLRNKYMNQLSAEYSKGELWAKKFSNAHRLFDIQFNKNDLIIQSIDSIWAHRNKLAHLNKRFHFPIKLKDLSGADFELSDLSSKEKYFDFCIKLVEIMKDGYNKIEKFEQIVWKKWEHSNFSPDLFPK